MLFRRTIPILHFFKTSTDPLSVQVFGDALLTSSLSTFGYVAGALFPKPTRAKATTQGTTSAISSRSAPPVPAQWITGYDRKSKFQRVDSQEPCMHFYRPSTGSCNTVDDAQGCVPAKPSNRSGPGRRQLKVAAHRAAHQSRKRSSIAALAASTVPIGAQSANSVAMATSASDSLSSTSASHTKLAVNSDRLKC